MLDKEKNSVSSRQEESEMRNGKNRTAAAGSCPAVRRSGNRNTGRLGGKGKRVFLAGLVGAVLLQPMQAEATTANEIQQNIEQQTNQISNINNQIAALEEEHDLIQEKIDDLNAEILNTMTSIGMKEDEIAAKEEEIAAKEEEIAAKEEEIRQKEKQIQETEAEYEAAVQKEEDQRQDMAVCARMIYERGDSTVLDAILGGKGLAEILNRADQVEKVYEYERNMLLSYIATKNQVHDLWERLEAEKTGLETDREALKTDREQLKSDEELLKADQRELESQKAVLDNMLAQKKQESANYEAEINKARQEAAVAKRLLQQEQQRLRQLQAASAGQNNQGSGQGSQSAAANATYASNSYTDTVDGASGSDLGKQIAKFGLQYIGNPYVYGGTSLTSGADCSGFTYRVYSEFGYSLPRTSYQQRSAGTGVSYEDAQPGDLICYDGHVGIYIGGGLIVHASSSRPYPQGGIKVNGAQYQTILAVRRIIQ